MTIAKAVGYLFSDIDGSVAKWERHTVAMDRARAIHNALLARVISDHGGTIEDAGDGVFARFERDGALACAVALQRAFRLEDWSEVEGLSIRLGLHVGMEEDRARDQRAINRVSRMARAAWGGQTVISALAAASFPFPPGAVLSDLGHVYLRGIAAPERLFGLSSVEFGEDDFPPLRGVTRWGPGLLAQTTPIFGRDRDLAKLLEQLREPGCWVTLSGAGGIGKTRLALEVAGAVAHEREVHVVMVGAGVIGADGLAHAMVNTLRLPRKAGVSDTDLLTEYAAGRSILFVIDNIDGTAGASRLIANLVEAGASVLATSREPTWVVGEQVFKVAGLDLDGRDGWQDSAAAMLFAQSARTVDASFDFSAADKVAFAQIHEAIRGSPLALHLTAQWVSVLPLSSIAANLSGGTQLLSALETTQRTLRDVFDRSWALLSEVQRQALTVLATFPGTFDAAAAQAVGQVGPSLLQALERKNLVERRTSFRFGLHPLVREFATEKLADDGANQAAIARSHAHHYLSRSEEDYRLSFGPHQARAAERARLDYSNIATAWAHLATSSESDDLLGPTERLFYRLASGAMYEEAIRIFCAPTPSEKLAARFAALRANCLVQLGRYKEGDVVARSALNAARDPTTRGHALQALANIAHANGRFDEAEELYRSALEIRADDQLGRFYTNLALAWLEVRRHRYAKAREWIARATTLTEEQGFLVGLMTVRQCEGDLAVMERRLEDASQAYRAALSLEGAVHNSQISSSARVKLARVQHEIGMATDGEAILGEAIELAAECRDERLRVRALVALGRIRSANPASAQPVLQEAFTSAAGSLRTTPEMSLALGALASVEAKVGRMGRAVELVAVARALGLPLATEEEGELRAHGLDVIDVPAVGSIDVAVDALLRAYQPSGSQPPAA